MYSQNYLPDLPGTEDKKTSQPGGWDAENHKEDINRFPQKIYGNKEWSQSP
jgi:hypothetical protein